VVKTSRWVAKLGLAELRPKSGDKKTRPLGQVFLYRFRLGLNGTYTSGPSRIIGFLLTLTRYLQRYAGIHHRFIELERFVLSTLRLKWMGTHLFVTASVSTVNRTPRLAGHLPLGSPYRESHAVT